MLDSLSSEDEFEALFSDDSDEGISSFMYVVARCAGHYTTGNASATNPVH